MTSPQRGEHDDHGLDDDELERKLAALEQQVSDLGEELARRQKALRQAQDYAAQQAEIDRLNEHLAAAQVNWQKVLEFFRSAIREQRAGTPWGEPPSPSSASDHGSDQPERDSS